MCKLAVYVSIITRSFLVYSFAGDTLSGSCKQNDKYYFHILGTLHTLYNVQLSYKYENVLKDMSWNDAYQIIGMED